VVRTPEQYESERREALAVILRLAERLGGLAPDHAAEMHLADLLRQCIEQPLDDPFGHGCRCRVCGSDQYMDD
jgi:hypothetical protein